MGKIISFSNQKGGVGKTTTCVNMASCLAKYGKKVLSDLEQYAVDNGWQIAPSNYEGIRISFGANDGDGWFLLRMSLHDPIMPLNIESNKQGGTVEIAKKLYQVLNKYDGLDLVNLEKFIG